MKKHLAITFILALAGTALVGCSGDAEVSKADDKTMRNNFSRALTPDEVAKMGSNSTKGAARPDRKPL